MVHGARNHFDPIALCVLARVGGVVNLAACTMRLVKYQAHQTGCVG
jgi:hypothetical protein